MQKILDFMTKNKKYFFYAGGVALLLFAGVFIFKNGNGAGDTLTVTRSDFINKVSVSGTVETADEADLGFASSGRVGKIYVKENQVVKKGQVLAQLEIGDLLADLKIKEVNSKQENTEVESAYRKLLSDGLALVANSDDYTADAPEISGIYKGAEGRYKIIIKKGGATYTDYTLFTFKLESTKRVINEGGPTPLGTQGLYISFSEDLESYDDTIWYLDIPNKASSSYLENYNAYMEAKAEFESQKLVTGDISSVVQAEIDKIRAEIRKSTIYAPFDGVITNIELAEGEVASQNEPVVSMEGEGIFQIESYVPEVNIALVRLKQTAEVTLDAYGEDVQFTAQVIAIDTAETIRDGVATYKVTFQFAGKDERIKSGMTANVSIIIFNKPGTIVLPGGVIIEKEGKNFVEVKKGAKIELREVTLGDVSSLGQVEVLGGLAEGEAVIINPESGE